MLNIFIIFKSMVGLDWTVTLFPGWSGQNVIPQPNIQLFSNSTQPKQKKNTTPLNFYDMGRVVEISQAIGSILL